MAGFRVFANRFGLYAYPEEMLERPLARDVFSKGLVYEPRTIEFIRENVGSGDVVTAGAFVGDFFPGIARALAPGAMLYSFEPADRSFEAAKKTIALNRLDNVSLRKVALGAKPGEALLRTRDIVKGQSAAATARIIKAPQSGEDGVLKIEMATLDSLIPEDRNIAILHFDLEGFERPALEGAVRTVTRCRPILILEGRGIGPDALNRLFPGCEYVEAAFFEKNLFCVDLASRGVTL